MFFCICEHRLPRDSLTFHTYASFTNRRHRHRYENTPYLSSASMHLPTDMLEERAPTSTATATESPLPLNHPIHSKKPPIVDPLPVKRSEETVLPLDHLIHSKKSPIVDPLPIRHDEPTPTTVLLLNHPIHTKKPPIVDPLPIKRDAPTATVLPLGHPIHKKKPPIIDPLPVNHYPSKRDSDDVILPLDHPIHKKKPAIVDPLPLNPFGKRERHRDDFWKREGRGGQPSAQDGPAAQGQVNVAAMNPQTLIDQLPSCIRHCLHRAPAGRCDPTDFQCLCQNNLYLTAALVSECGASVADIRTAGRSTARAPSCSSPSVRRRASAVPRS